MSSYGYGPKKEEYARRLRRIEGQVRGLQRMVDEDRYCIDILTQVAAVTRALQSMAVGLLEQHLGDCVRRAVQSDDEEGSAKVAEAAAAIERLLKS